MGKHNADFLSFATQGATGQITVVIIRGSVRSLIAPGPHLQVREKMSDRDPDTLEPFPSVMAMREAKLRDWLAEAGRLGMQHHIACRDFMLDPM